MARAHDAARGHARQEGGGEEEEDAPEQDAGPVRAFWSGTLTFGLVSVPVELYPAVRSRRASLRMLDDEGSPLQRHYQDPETEREVARDTLVRGYEVDEDAFVEVTDQELDAVAPEKSRDIDLRRFVPADALDPLYFKRSYFLAPGGASTKAYRLLAAAMEGMGRAGIATFVMRGVEYLTAITAKGGILRAETLRFQDEVRSPEDVALPELPKPSATRKRAVAKAVGALAAEGLDERELEDAWSARLHALAGRKRRKGTDVVGAPEGQERPDGASDDDKVTDLLEVLRRRMAGSGGGGGGAGGGRPAAQEAPAAGAPKSAQAKKRPAPAESEAEHLAGLSKNALYQRAKRLDIPGRASMSKQQLVQAILAHQGEH